jgi:hypothetical protein
MSYVIRKLWAKKPKQWGPAKQVTAALRDRLENLGIEWASVKLALPFWSSGDQFDYGPNSLLGVNHGCSFVEDKLLVGDSQRRVSFPTKEIEAANEFTLLSKQIVIQNNIPDWWEFLHNRTQYEPSDLLFEFRFGQDYMQSNKYSLHFGYRVSNNWQIWDARGVNYVDGSPFSTVFSHKYGDPSAIEVRLNGNIVTNGSWKLGDGTLIPKKQSELPVGVGSITSIGDTEYVAGEDAVNGAVYYVLYFDRVLSDEQKSTLTENPYQLWQKNSSMYYSIPAPASAPTSTEAFIAPKFSVPRKLWDQKPKQWGPAKQVTAALRDRLENLGIGWDDVILACPLWNPGQQIDYGPFAHAVENNNVEYTDNSLLFGSYHYLYFGNKAEYCVNSDDFSMFVSYKYKLDEWYPRLLNFGNAWTPGAWALLPYHQDHGNHFAVDIYSTGQVHGTSPLIENKNYNVAFGRQGTDLNLFVNGIKEGTRTHSTALGHTDSTDFAIGKCYGNDYHSSLGGNVNQLLWIKKYNKALFGELAENPYQLWQRKPQVFYSHQTTPAVDVRSFVAPKFSVPRKLWDQKPKQWGPEKEVANNLKERIEHIGIDYNRVSVASPLWNAGQQIDYGPEHKRSTYNTGTFRNNSLYFNGNNTYAKFRQSRDEQFNNGDGFSLLFRFIDHDQSAGNGKGIFQQASTVSSGVPTILFQNQGTLYSWYLNGVYHNTAPLTKGPQNVVLTWNESEKYVAYQNEYLAKINTAFSGNISDGFYIGNGYSGYLQSTFEYFLNILGVITDEQRQSLMENPYQLWQRKPSTFYSFGVSSFPAPTISLGAGVYKKGTLIELSAEEGAQIYYTTDRSRPTQDSTLYTEPFEVFTGMLRAIAVKNNTESSTSSAEYIIGASAGDTLIISDNGVWNGNPSSFIKKWYADNSEIPGASEGTYVVTDDDIGKEINLGLIGVNFAGPGDEAKSNKIIVVSDVTTFTFEDGTTFTFEDGTDFEFN